MDVNCAMNKRLKAPEDRLSKLPDEILGHILSLLPTKEAIATVALSTRYKDLFSMIPNPQIVLFDTLLKNPRRRSSMHSIINLTNMIDKLIHLQLPSIESLTLSLQVVNDGRQIADWIGSFLALSPKKLELHVSSYIKKPEILMQRLSGCGLRSLDLCINTSYVPEPGLDLPELKELSVTMAHFEFINVLVKGCPLLEGLDVMHCFGDLQENLCINSPSLRCLRIENSWPNFSTGLVLDAPNLKKFMYRGLLNQNYNLERLRSLEIAQLEVSLGILPLSSGPRDQEMRVLAGCCDARGMWVSELMITAFVDHLGPIPQFPNLCVVGMKTMGVDGWAFLLKLLKHAPRLSIFFVKEGIDSCLSSVGVRVLEDNSIRFRIRERTDGVFLLGVGRPVAAEPALARE